MNTRLFNSEGKELSVEEVISMLPITMVNRVEVIDGNGRAYVNTEQKNKVGLSIQDSGRTLKVFISK